MRPQPRIVVALVATVVALATLASSASSQSDPDIDDARAIVTAALRGSGASLHDTTGQSAGKQLRIRLSDMAPADGDGDSATASLELAELGWRASVASAFVGSRSSQVFTWRMVDSKGVVPDAAVNLWRGILRADHRESLSAAFPKLGTVSADDALAQLQANADLLKRELPAVRSASIEAIRFPKGRNAFALALTIRVEDLTQLEGEYGNLLLGPATGLTGSTGAVVEGFAVTLTDDNDRYIGSWTTTRTGLGTMIAHPELRLPRQLPITLPFAVQTGGPKTPSGIMGAASSGPPRALFAAAANRVTVPAAYVQCDRASCPPGAFDTGRCLSSGRATNLRVNTMHAATAVRVLLFERRSIRDGTPKEMAQVTAAPIANSATRWRMAIPAQVRVSVAQVEVTYRTRPTAVFVVELAGTRDCTLN